MGTDQDGLAERSRVLERARPLRFRLLGPTEAHSEHGAIPLGAPQQRCVLVVLLLDPGRVVPVERLVDAVWPGDPPASARKAIQVYVSHVRRALRELGEVKLVTVRPGYRLDVDPDLVDVHRFRSLVQDATRADDVTAVRMLSEALSLWRGPAVADITHDGLRTLLVAGLHEERLAAVEERCAARLRLGNAVEVIAELTEHVAAYPLRERGYRLLMGALCDCGRRAEALEVYERARRVLADSLGADPGPELRRLHQQILRGRVARSVLVAAGEGDGALAR